MSNIYRVKILHLHFLHTIKKNSDSGLFYRWCFLFYHLDKFRPLIQNPHNLRQLKSGLEQKKND